MRAALIAGGPPWGEHSACGELLQESPVSFPQAHERGPAGPPSSPHGCRALRRPPGKLKAYLITISVFLIFWQWIRSFCRSLCASDIWFCALSRMAFLEDRIPGAPKWSLKHVQFAVISSAQNQRDVQVLIFGWIKSKILFTCIPHFRALQSPTTKNNKEINSSCSFKNIWEFKFLWFNLCLKFCILFVFYHSKQLWDLDDEKQDIIIQNKIQTSNSIMQRMDCNEASIVSDSILMQRLRNCGLQVSFRWPMVCPLYIFIVVFNCIWIASFIFIYFIY